MRYMGAYLGVGACPGHYGIVFNMAVPGPCALILQKAEAVSKMEADLERLKKDRGQGEPVKLMESVRGGAKGVAMTGQPIEIKLGGGEESGEDSDDLPAEGGGEENDEGQGT